jgi:CHAT domain-containing protein
MFGDDLDRYEDDNATVGAVLDALGGYRWVHFSCHGLQDLNDPSRAGLVLRDGVATIRQISERQYAGEFAFLSACRTATGGLHLPDEAITLAAALNYTGFRRVVGTLWSVDQTVAADVTRAVYATLSEGGVFDPTRSAYALHDAILAVRADPDRSLVDWLPFVHSGL